MSKFKRNKTTWFQDYLSSHPCAECGAVGPYWRTTFAYLNEADASQDTPKRLAERGYSKQRVLAEIRKGIVVCVNCAATITELRRQKAALQTEKRDHKEFEAALYEKLSKEMGLAPHFGEQILRAEGR